jgi:hypothetical protein
LVRTPAEKALNGTLGTGIFLKLPWTVYLDAMGFDAEAATARPTAIERKNHREIREMVEVAGPAWNAAIASDIARLRGERGAGEAESMF